MSLIREGVIIAPKGARIEIRIDTVCLHGDSPRRSPARTLRTRLGVDGLTNVRL